MAGKTEFELTPVEDVVMLGLCHVLANGASVDEDRGALALAAWVLGSQYQEWSPLLTVDSLSWALGTGKSILRTPADEDDANEALRCLADDEIPAAVKKHFTALVKSLRTPPPVWMREAIEAGWAPKEPE